MNETEIDSFIAVMKSRAVGTPGTPERRLFRRGLDTGVDQLVADRGIFRPGRNQPPAQGIQPRAFGAGANDRRVLLRRKIVTRRQLHRSADQARNFMQFPPGYRLQKPPAASNLASLKL